MTNRWIAGARLPTLPASLVPVLVGTAAAFPPYRLDRAVLAAIVALALQVGVNYANDYSDGIRGTDAQRVGPVRLVASGLATPAEVLRAAMIAFGIAIVAGVVLSLAVNPWLIVVGLASVAAAWYYTGGKTPYGYRGLGELSVFIFFGLVGTLGSTYVQHGSFTPPSALLSCAVGCLATALLVVNNLRDIPGDTASGKHTLAVRLGDARTRALYVALLGVAALATLAAAIWDPWAALGLIAAAPAIRPVRTVTTGARGPALVPALIDTGRVELIFGILVAAGIAFGR